MSPENQAENTTPSIEGAAKATPPKPSKPKSSMIQAHPEGERIHPKRAEGRLAKLRIVVVLTTQFVFYVISRFNWNGRQAILFNIPDRHFFIFGLSLGMDDLIYPALLLMICAFGLFWWTTIAGRLWHDYSCPQTVYTEITLWIDNLIKGDRNKRSKLEKSPWDFTKIRTEATEYLLIFLVCAWTGIAFAGWPVPIHQFVPDLFTGVAGGGAIFTTAFCGFMTFFFAHIMHEKACLHTCPCARFQSTMFDKDTLIISYDAEHGELRGARKKVTNKEDNDLGGYISCAMCVQICPVDINIRNGLQYQCIDYAACISACDEIMDKMGYERGLIRYTTEGALEHEYPEGDVKKCLKRPRIAGYGAVLLVVVITFLVDISARRMVEVDILKDHGIMIRENSQGWLEGAYSLRIINNSENERLMTATVRGFDEITLTDLPENGIRIAPQGAVAVPVQVSTIPEYAGKGSHPIEFTFIYRETGSTDSEPTTLEEKTTFVGEQTVSPQPQIKSWYEHIWLWVLMTGPIFVVIANVSIFFVAKEHTIDLASDDYYKDGKHIEIQLHRDEEVAKRRIQAQVLISPDMNATRIFVSGQFDTRQPLNLLLMHPTRKTDDQTVKLCTVTAEPQSGRMEYRTVLKPLHPTNHWYLRVEDASGVQRAENKWVVSQGNAVNLTPMDRLLDNGKQAVSTEQQTPTQAA